MIPIKSSNFLTAPITGIEIMDKILRMHWMIGLFKPSAMNIKQKIRSWIVFLFIIPSMWLFSTFCIWLSFERKEKIYETWIASAITLQITLVSFEILFVVMSDDMRMFLRKLDAHLRKYDDETDSHGKYGNVFIKIFLLYNASLMIVVILRIIFYFLMEDFAIFFVNKETNPDEEFILQIVIKLMNVAQLITVPFLAVAHDMMMPMAMLQIEKVFFLLTNEVPPIINSRDRKQNERNLIDFVKLHVDALEVVGRFRKTFGVNLSVKIYSAFITTSMIIFNMVSLFQNTTCNLQ